MFVDYAPEQYAVVVLGLVYDDMRAGVVPQSVRSFAELHDCVDANEYLQEAGVPFGTDAGAGEDGSGVVNAVCDLVSRVLATGVHAYRCPCCGEAVTDRGPVCGNCGESCCGLSRNDAGVLGWHECRRTDR